MTFLSYGSSLVIYQPSEQKEEMIKQTLINNQQEAMEHNSGESGYSGGDSPSDWSSLSSTSREKQKEKRDNMRQQLRQQARQKQKEQTEDYNIRETVFNKRVHYTLVNLVVGILLMVIFEVSITKSFKEDQTVYLLFFMLFESILL